MVKEKVIRVRIGEEEEKRLDELEKKYHLTKSQIVREGIANYESMHESRLYPLKVQEVLKSVGKDYIVDSCGIVEDDILLGKGVWIDLQANYFIPRQKCIQYGDCQLTMKDNLIHVEGGYLEDISKCLMILHRERKRGGVGMNFFSISDENDNVKSYLLVSYEIKKLEDCVEVEFHSIDYSVVYDLRPDTRFKTVDEIRSYLDKLLETIVTAGYMLKIDEYLVRKYVMIGYETDDEYVSGQFTASKHEK